MLVLAAGGLGFLSLFAVSAADRALYGKNDFLPFYAGGRLAFTGHLYDQGRVLAEEHRAGGVAGESLHFIRPPWFAAALWPLARLSYPDAYLIWELLLAASIGAFALWFGPPGRVANLVVLCFSIPALAALLNGQDTPLLLAWLTAGVVLVRSGKPFEAGLVLALCQTKFHLFLPLWLILIAGHRWRLLGGLAAGNSALAVASFAIAGWRWPLDYLESIGRDAVTPGADHMPTFYHALTSLNLPEWWVLAPVAGIAVASWMAGRRLDAEASVAIAPALVMPFLKHTYVFDAVVLLPVLILALNSKSLPRRLTAVALLTPIPWIGCLAGYPASLVAPALVLVFAGTHFPLKTVGVAADEGNCTGGTPTDVAESDSSRGTHACEPVRPGCRPGPGD